LLTRRDQRARKTKRWPDNEPSKIEKDEEAKKTASRGRGRGRVGKSPGLNGKSTCRPEFVKSKKKKK
jgi:hypothetical protein